MRRDEKAMTPESAEDFLSDRARAVGRLAVIASGEPYVVPLHFVMHDGAVYFHSAQEGRKIDAVGNGTPACMLVDEVLGVQDGDEPCSSSTYYRSVMLFGRVEPVGNTAEKRTVLRSLIRKYSAETSSTNDLNSRAVDATCVLRLTIDRMTGKEHLPPADPN